jgi:septal ring-binding cell division protein DamX
LNILRSNLLPSIVAISVVTLLAACEPTSETSSPWVKSDSPWGKRTAAVTDTAEAPAADTYKEDLAKIDTGTSAVDMGYQAEKVESVVPAEPVAEVVEPTYVEEAAPVVAVAPARAPAAAAGDDDFKSIPAAYYTVQVIASVSKNDIYVHAKKYGLATRYVIPTVRGGTTWYVLLLDTYPSKAAAKAALDEAATTLPAKPWMRTVGSVQQIMP